MNYTIYRTKAALRFSLSRNPRTQTVNAFIEAAPAIDGQQTQPKKGQRKYDWQNQKLSMSVSGEELLAIAERCERIRLFGTKAAPLPLYHDPQKGGYNGEPKTFSISPYVIKENKTRSKSGSSFTGIINLSVKEARHTIGLTPANLYAIELFAKKAASILLGWDTVEQVSASATTVNQAQPEAEKKPEQPKQPQPDEEEIIDEDIGEDEIPF